MACKTRMPAFAVLTPRKNVLVVVFAVYIQFDPARNGKAHLRAFRLPVQNQGLYVVRGRIGSGELNSTGC